MELSIKLMGVLMVAFTILPLVRTNAWWIRVLDFPRLQIFLASIITLVAFFILMKNTIDSYSLLLALGLCTAYQGARIFPYTPLAGLQVPSGIRAGENSFTLFFANVLMENRESDRLKAIIHDIDPDIILVVETDLWWQESLKDFENSYPYTVKQPQDDTYGMHLYSRFELIDPKIRFLVHDSVPSISGRIKLPAGKLVKFHCLHPPPPFPTESESSEERDTELSIIAREIDDKPVIVLGDLNDVAWSRTNNEFQQSSGLKDPRVGRGFYNTFHAKIPILRFPLDHFFVSHHFSIRNFRRLPPFGSDHFPVCIDLDIQ
ncbi:MAG: endonuclease/exonuclease/phosphatase family protein [Balneolales bacterium]